MIGKGAGTWIMEHRRIGSILRSEIGLEKLRRSLVCTRWLRVVSMVRLQSWKHFMCLTMAAPPFMSGLDILEERQAGAGGFGTEHFHCCHQRLMIEAQDA